MRYLSTIICAIYFLSIVISIGPVIKYYYIPSSNGFQTMSCNITNTTIIPHHHSTNYDLKVKYIFLKDMTNHTELFLKNVYYIEAYIVVKLAYKDGSIIDCYYYEPDDDLTLNCCPDISTIPSYVVVLLSICGIISFVSIIVTFLREYKTIVPMKLIDFDLEDDYD